MSNLHTTPIRTPCESNIRLRVDLWTDTEKKHDEYIPGEGGDLYDPT